MAMFAIRSKSTGAFLPNAEGRGGRGFTHVELAPGRAPRIFYREQDAKAALKWWLGGIVRVTHVSSSWETPEILDDENWDVQPVPGREADDMEIVEIELVVKP